MIAAGWFVLIFPLLLFDWVMMIEWLVDFWWCIQWYIDWCLWLVGCNDDIPLTCYLIDWPVMICIVFDWYIDCWMNDINSIDIHCWLTYMITLILFGWLRYWYIWLWSSGKGAFGVVGGCWWMQLFPVWYFHWWLWYLIRW